MKIHVTGLLTLSICVLSAGSVALGDWDPGQEFKMHFPQLPDPIGWDVSADQWRESIVADDWLCTASGPVSDIHIWGSWRQDQMVPIQAVHVSIHSDIPAGQAGGPPFSMPGQLLWERDFDAAQITVQDYGQGDQGFLVPEDPTGGGIFPDDHGLFHQINIDPIPNPFIQEEGTIYWLDIQVIHETPNAWWGWKTSQDHWNDNAVFWADGEWLPLVDPRNQEPLDMAFVITPEPTTMILLASGLPLLLKRRRKS